MKKKKNKWYIFNIIWIIYLYIVFTKNSTYCKKLSLCLCIALPIRHRTKNFEFLLYMLYMQGVIWFWIMSWRPHRSIFIMPGKVVVTEYKCTHIYILLCIFIYINLFLIIFIIQNFSSQYNKKTQSHLMDVSHMR